MAKQVKYDFNPFALTGQSSRGIKNKSEVLEEIADFVVDKLKQRTQDGMSPVKGRGRFKKLTEEYADAKKSGDRTPNLTLTSDMLDSLDAFNTRGNTMRVTVDRDENDKADGHNNHSGDSSLPERRFIPDSKDGETFKRDIIDGIRRIIKEVGERGSSNGQ